MTWRQPPDRRKLLVGHAKEATMTTKTWMVQIRLDEETDTTAAEAVLDTDGKTDVRGRGRSRRNPADPAVPMIGDELAAARALSDLAHNLLEAAAHDIESSTHKPAELQF
jgi:Domain of unknown function (DUF1876)